jgi:type IV pilus assembly protein PilV
MKRSPPCRCPSHARGLSLLEVLISIVLFSIGLIGIVTLQARAVQISVSADDQLRASLLANEMASQMWNARSVNLSASAVAAWAARAADATGPGLPNADATVAVTGDTARIEVAWRPVNVPATQPRHRVITHVTVAAP